MNTDPGLIACRWCKAEIGAWCIVSRTRDGVRSRFTVVGFIHASRSQAARRYRRRGRVDGRQLPLFE